MDVETIGDDSDGNGGELIYVGVKWVLGRSSIVSLSARDKVGDGETPRIPLAFYAGALVCLVPCLSGAIPSLDAERVELVVNTPWNDTVFRLVTSESFSDTLG